ncbi:hypothetical protein AB4248_26490, partial [Vibrio splendidus]
HDTLTIKHAIFHIQTTFKLNKLYRYTEKKVKMVCRLSMNLILGFVGKTHAPKMCRAFYLTSFGADLS